MLKFIWFAVFGSTQGINKKKGELAVVMFE